ncbi:MAG TPA: DUF1574 family protein, partial [Turneriella sp.]|nr:DUF1574 family protein [Turneriella sp.]HNE18653.1 DUF1574 family protein [Turneriella sp.]HNJ65401.1 DUF1574 family protein [Turneriella sp.]HNL09212.1 DUF1574 family protein [Turneriella sp.]HNL54706.1 DUF1574 family protein [Turneriella sp.]
MSSSDSRMKQKRYWLYYPVLLLVLLFVADKALLCRSHNGVTEGGGIRLTETARIRLDKEASFVARKPGARTVVVFGSSRSERFNLLKQENQISEYLNPKQKEQIQQTQFLVYAQVGAQMVAYYHALDHLWRRNMIPDAVVLELGPELLELEHKNNHGKSEFIFADEYDYEYYRFLEKYGKKSVAEEARARLLFAGYAIKPRPELLVHDYRGKAQDEQPEYSLIEKYVRSYKDYLDSDLTGKLREERVGQFVTMYGNNYKIFAVDPLMDESLRRIVKMAKEKNVPLLLYKPFVHEELKAVLDKTPYAPAVDRYAKELVGGTVSFHYASQNDYQCKYWSDASHYSTRCTPEIMYHLLSVLKFFP